MSGWDRRTFLKAGAFGATGLALQNKPKVLSAVEKPWNVKAGRSVRKFRDPVPTVCRMCPAHCGIIAFRDGDRVVQIQGNVGAPTNRGGLCSRAYAGLERLYDAERQLQPLLQTGRGSGQWRPITWEEALSKIVARLEQPEARATLHVGQEEILVEELRATLGWSQVLVDRPLPGRPGPGSGQQWYGAPTLWPDLSRTRTVFLFGLRALEDRLAVPVARDLLQAARDGASIHFFGSFEGATGSIAWWHPVAPNSAATVAWGVAGLLLQWGSFNREALAERVLDTPEELTTALQPYTPENVAQAAGIPADALVSLARQFGEGKPSLALAPPDDPAAPAAALLNHLVGSVNRRGGVALARGPFFVQSPTPTTTPEAWLKALVGGDVRTDLYWVSGSNPAYEAPQSRKVAHTLAHTEKVGLIVAMDTHMTETATLADIFLPLATHFEAWGLLEGCLPDGRSYLFLQQPATRPASEPEKLKDPDAEHLSLFSPWPRPLGESRSLGDVLLTLAGRLDPEGTSHASTRAYLGDLLRKSWGPGSFEALSSRGIWVSEEGRTPNRSEEVTIREAIPPTPPARASGGLYLVGYAPEVLPYGFSNSRWGREIHHRSEALLHPETARRIGVAAGGEVILRTTAGEARVPVRLVQGIHRDAVALQDGFGHTAGGSAALASATAPTGSEIGAHTGGGGGSASGPPARATEPAETIWWAHAGPGVSLRALYPFRISPEQVQDWGPLAVEVLPV